MPRKDRRQAKTDVRLEFRRQVVELRAMGKTMAEISAITGYARTYCSTLLKWLSAEPARLESLWLVGATRRRRRRGAPTSKMMLLYRVGWARFCEVLCRKALRYSGRPRQERPLQLSSPRGSGL